MSDVYYSMLIPPPKPLFSSPKQLVFLPSMPLILNIPPSLFCENDQQIPLNVFWFILFCLILFYWTIHELFECNSFDLEHCVCLRCARSNDVWCMILRVSVITITDIRIRLSNVNNELSIYLILFLHSIWSQHSNYREQWSVCMAP